MVRGALPAPVDLTDGRDEEVDLLLRRVGCKARPHRPLREVQVLHERLAAVVA